MFSTPTPPPTDRGNFDQSDSTFRASDTALPEPLPGSPWGLFKAWFDAAHAQKVQPNPNAMTLATIDPDGKPSARIVLCKGMDLSNGHIVFYTNYDGRKGRALAANPRAALVFHWDDLDKQVRIEGPVGRSPEAESEAYFASRPWISRIGAWTSSQTQPVASRADLLRKLEDTYRRFGIDPANLPPRDAKLDIPRPEHWGGFRLFAERVELWVGGEGRLHDRAVWTRSLRPGGPGEAQWTGATPWAATRLQP